MGVWSQAAGFVLLRLAEVWLQSPWRYFVLLKQTVLLKGGKVTQKSVPCMRGQERRLEGRRGNID
jgi:hypothetical protein